MITAIYWQDSTSDTYPLAWRNFDSNDLTSAMAWVAQQRRSYTTGCVRVFRKRGQIQRMIHHESW
jgi:hypothetical protein